MKNDPPAAAAAASDDEDDVRTHDLSPSQSHAKKEKVQIKKRSSRSPIHTYLGERIQKEKVTVASSDLFFICSSYQIKQQH